MTSDFLRRRPNTLEVSLEHYESFRLDEEIGQLLEMGRPAPQPVHGSDIAADFILRTLRVA